MARAGLEVPSAKVWFEFWKSNRAEFLRDALTYRNLAEKVGVTGDDISEAVRKVETNIATRFPAADGELNFLSSMVARSHKSAERFTKKAIDEQHRDADSGFAQEFNFWSDWFSICMSQLSFMADPDDEEEVTVKDDILRAIFDTARLAAFNVNHAAMEAVALRRTPRNTDIEPTTSERIEDGDLVDVERAIRRFEAGVG